MGGGDEVDIMGTTMLKAKYNFLEVMRGNFMTVSFLGYVIVLTEFAPEVAVSKKDCARAPGARDGWLFPVVQLGLGDFNFIGCPASAWAD